MTPKPRLFIRADGNSQIGLGHIIRSLALAQMLQPEFTVDFLIQAPSLAIKQEIENAGINIIALPATTSLLTEVEFLTQNILKPGNILILDGYQFTTAYQEKLKAQNIGLVCLDDIHAFPFVADVLINPAGGLKPAYYQVKSYTQLCLGPNFALLREPFLNAAKVTREIPEIRNIFLNMGGADPDNQTCFLLEKLIPVVPEINFKVVVGNAYQHQKALQNIAQDHPGVTIYQHLSAAEMANLMAACDAAILPPSSVAYEWCCVSGLLFLFQIADNQENIKLFLQKEGLAFSFADFTNLMNSPDLPEKISGQIKKQRQYFHGQSQDNLRRLFRSLFYQQNLTLRKVTAADTLTLFNWANDPEVRQNSFTATPIPLEVHKIWLENKLKAANCFFLIAEINEHPAGMIRFDLQTTQATISYLLNAQFRGKGLGSLLLEKGLSALQHQHPEIKTAIGYIQEKNQASVISFQKNGFAVSVNIPPAVPNSLVFEKRLN